MRLTAIVKCVLAYRHAAKSFVTIGEMLQNVTYAGFYFNN